ncbi:MAG: cbb3-type cytochrome c oxidase subunit 3 [Gammaproteobacteria bacterium]|jgi:cytochrome c oxidase cbb3-type subunit 4|nr:cbb3-type cytochrome c oxidase subunit 3 [Gammaproteobacteria bacterium]MDH3933950.1 cbb3-type cytochrome c oxidase subunit 3 [Gammaproteobacteria bacterium]MDH3971295.1 cbb3-type cytochrome c oxidase subunit 3 [Gammaproteobacteria bacterium]
MDVSIVQSVWTLVVLVLFVGIVIWAWSGKRKQEFDEAANIPFHEDDKPAATKSKENSHG